MTLFVFSVENLEACQHFKNFSPVIFFLANFVRFQVKSEKMLQPSEAFEPLQCLNFVAGNFQHGKIFAVQIDKFWQLIIFEKVVAQLELEESVISNTYLDQLHLWHIVEGLKLRHVH